MGFLKRLFGGGDAERGRDPDASPTGSAAAVELDEEPPETVWDPAPGEHRLVAWIRLTDASLTHEREQLKVFGLERAVMVALDESGAGTYETNDLERGYFRMYVRGPDANRLVEAVRPALAAAPPGSYLAKRAGPAGTSEERVDL